MIFNYVYVHSKRIRKIARNGQTKSGPNFSRTSITPSNSVVQRWSLCSYDGCSKRLEQPQPYSLAGSSLCRPFPGWLYSLLAVFLGVSTEASACLTASHIAPGSCRWMRDNKFHNCLNCPVSCINLTFEKYAFLIFFIADCMTKTSI